VCKNRVSLRELGYITVRLPRSTKKLFKFCCVMERTTMSKKIRSFIEDYVSDFKIYKEGGGDESTKR
jgi:hypothetical protein